VQAREPSYQQRPLAGDVGSANVLGVLAGACHRVVVDARGFDDHLMETANTAREGQLEHLADRDGLARDCVEQDRRVGDRGRPVDDTVGPMKERLR
jgi:hypothetical protein